MKPAKDRTGRYITLTQDMDKWLEKEAKKRNFRSVQEYMLDIFRRERLAVLNQSEAAAA
jgi:hypothetical protein